MGSFSMRGAADDRHPLIHFRSGEAGVPRAGLVARRLFVWQVVSTLRESGNSIEATAEYLALSDLQVRACLSYHADFEDEVEEAARQERDFAEREEARWEREQEPRP